MTFWPHPRQRQPELKNARATLSTLLMMASTIESRDPFTGGHLWRVSRFAEMLARRAGMGAVDVHRIAIGGFLHDLGKIAVPESILCKRTALDEDERDIMRTHPDVGARLLASHPLASLAQDAVRFHHERPDGTGYPHGLRGDEIPRDARIVAICEAFDTMTSARPYRKAIPIAAALTVIRDNLGTQFDTRLGEHFLGLADTGMFKHIVGHSDDGTPLQHCAMCGPTLVARREQRAGGLLHCRNCGGEYVLATAINGTLEARQTGRVATARDLEPAPDMALIGRFIENTVRAAMLSELAQAA